jgi:hypothetical protein
MLKENELIGLFTLYRPFGKVCGPLTKLIEQTRILDRYHRLGGEVRD